MVKKALWALFLLIEYANAQSGVSVSPTGSGSGTNIATGCTWTPTADRNTPNGQQQSAATTLDLCKTQCAALPSCQILGFDFNPLNPVGSQCFFSTSSVLGTANGITHYNYTCSAGGTGSGGTGPTSSPLGCTFIPTANQHTSGGAAQPSAMNIDQCQTLCLTSSTCLTFGFDFNPTAAPGAQCWFSINWQLGSANGITHYNVSCSGGTGSTPLTGGSCDAGVKDVNTLGGVLQPSYTTLLSCQQACIAALSGTCKFGFDYNLGAASGQNCWFSTTTTQNPAPGITHYMCSGSTGLPPTGNCDPVKNVNTFGGTLQTYTTLAACQSACLAALTTTCKFGFDWNTNAASGSQCWFSATNITSPNTGIDHYTCVTTSLTTTPPAGNCDPVKNVNTFGGTLQTHTTLAACQSACLAASTTTCKFGFDWDNTAASGSQCWFSSTSSTNPKSGVDHYTCAAASLTTTSPAGNCDPVKNVNTLGGTLQNYSTLAACQSACLAALTTTCKSGFDWDTTATIGSQCWFSSTSITNPRSGVDHYTCAAVTTTTPIPLANCDTLSKNMNTLGGILQPGISSIAACKAACIAAYNCTINGFDYDNVGNSCWFSTTSVTMTANNVDHYSCIRVTTPAPVVCYVAVSASYVDPSPTLEDCYKKCMTIPACALNGFDWDSSAPVGERCYLNDVPTKINATVTHYVDDKTCQSKSIPWNQHLGACSMKPDQSVAGSTLVSNVTTVDQCITLCLQTSACLGFDWVTVTNKCFQSTTSTTVPSPGTNHYNCQKGICYEVKNQKVAGGAQQTGVTTIEECKYRCLVSPTCNNGFDWDYTLASGSQCFLSPATGALTAGTNVSHYVCPKAVDDICWTVMNNMNANASKPIAGANTLDACKIACKANPTCASNLYGFDWNPSAPLDYMCNLVTSVSLVYTPGSYHYRYKCGKNCVETSGMRSVTPVLQSGVTKYDECKVKCLQNPTACNFGINFKFDPTNSVFECYFASALSATPDASYITWLCTGDY